MSIELAWAAGLWDGEGCCFVSGKSENRPPRVKLYISQKHNDYCIQRFYRAVGQIGNLSERIRPDHKVAGTVYMWRAFSRGNVESVMSQLWPYLSTPKKSQYLACRLTCGW